MFDHKCVFRIKDQEGIDVDELQLDLCDYDDDPEVFVEEQGTSSFPEASREFLTPNLRMLLLSSARH